jgi:putative regulatory protein, FmdB family
MPIYAYACSACGVHTDVMQKMSDAPLTICSECGKESLVKQLTAPSFQLKGNGYYVTDFKNGSQAKPASADAAPAASSPSPLPPLPPQPLNVS